MQTQAQAVIIGGGIAGASIAYHLAQLGWRDVLVLEQSEFISGTTSHAPGLVGQLRSSPSLMRMLMNSVSLYRTLSVNGMPGFLGEGSLRLASSKPRWRQLEQQAAAAQSVGLDAHLLSPSEVAAKAPILHMTDIEGALWIPNDGSATAPVLAAALLQRATDLGVALHPRTKVTTIEVVNNGVRAVQTPQGRIATDTVVVAAGIWSPFLGRMAGVALPLVPLHHQYAETASLPELASATIPNLRDPDYLIYFRQKGQGLVLGGYERNPQPFDGEALAGGENPTLRSFGPNRFHSLWRAAQKRAPCLVGAPLARQVNGLEAFTPDGEFLLGPAAEVRGFWAACGFCAHGVSGAGGVGKVLAEWIVNGDPGLDVAAMDLRRFRGRQWDVEDIRNAACRVYGTYYDIPGSPH